MQECPEMGFIAMDSPYDPAPSLKIEGGRVTEMDGKRREDFDFNDSFIADHAIDLAVAEVWLTSAGAKKKSHGWQAG